MMKNSLLILGAFTFAYGCRAARPTYEKSRALNISKSEKSDEQYNEINFNLPFLSSLKSIVLKPKETFVQSSSTITLYPERQQCLEISDSELENKAIDFKYKLQSSPDAPLLILIPGTGGDANSSMVQYFAMLAYRAGYSVIELISTTNYAFALAASADGHTGYIPNDARDYYMLILAVKEKIANLEHISILNPKRTGLLGYSYGGLDIGFLLAEDLVKKAINFDFAITLNSPFSRKYAAERVDEYDQSFNFSTQIQENINNIASGKIKRFSSIEEFFSDSFEQIGHYFDALYVGLEHQKIIIPNLPSRLEDYVPFSASQGGKLIASAFRADIANTSHAANLISYCKGKSLNADLQLPKHNSALVTPIVTYLRQGPLSTVAAPEYNRRVGVRGQVTSKFNSVLFDQIIDEKFNESDLETALDKVYGGFSESGQNGHLKRPVIKIFHAQDDFLTFGPKSPADRLLVKWKGYGNDFIEVVSMTEHGGHMGQFADNKVLVKLYRTMLQLKK